MLQALKQARSYLNTQRASARAWLTTDNRDWWIGAPLVSLFIAGAIYDIWLVDTGRSSITNTVTRQCLAHPTLIAFGWLLGMGLHALVIRFMWMVIAVWVLIGHLFTGMVIP